MKKAIAERLGGWIAEIKLGKKEKGFCPMEIEGKKRYFQINKEWNFFGLKIKKVSIYERRDYPVMATVLIIQDGSRNFIVRGYDARNFDDKDIVQLEEIQISEVA